jgi:TolA-binding protein
LRSFAALGVGVALLVGCSSLPRLVSSDDLEARDRRILALEHELQRSRAELVALRARLAAIDNAGAGTNRPAPLPAGEASPARAAAEDAPEPALPSLERGSFEESDLEEPLATGTATDRSAYDAALALIRAGNAEQGERALAAVAADPAHLELADNAWFWIGESRLVRGERAGAIEAYRTAIERHPDGNKIPDALFKLGVALDQDGRATEAREVWQELADRFPQTVAGERALERLATR